MADADPDVTPQPQALRPEDVLTAIAFHDPDECRQCSVRRFGGQCLAWSGALRRTDAVLQRLRSHGWELVRESWTRRFAGDVIAALGDEHRPRWSSGKPCPEHAIDQCCFECCTTCYLLCTLADNDYSAVPEGFELVRTKDLDALLDVSRRYPMGSAEVAIARAAVVEGRTR